MNALSTSQIKAGRALLDWTQQDLAEASGIGPTAIRDLEKGFRPRHSTMDAVRVALEHAGLEFTAGDGVRRRRDTVKIHEGSDNCDKFFEEVLETAKRDGGDVLVSIKSQNVLAQPCGLTRITNLQRLELLRESVDVKCLLSNAISPSLFMSSLEMRTVPAQNLGAATCIVYGNKYAEIMQETGRSFLIVAFSIPAVAHDYRKQFLTAWMVSPTSSAQTPPLSSRLKAVV